jgi:glycosyltransferase involved in cell wall biosynthesis
MERLQALNVPVDPLPLRRFKRTSSPLPLARDIAKWALTVPRLAAYIHHHRFDLIHANSTQAQLYAGPAARLAGCPVLWHVRDRLRGGGLGRWLARFSTGIVAVSQAIAEELVAAGVPPEKVVTVWNGVDPEAFHPGVEGASLRAELGVPKEAFVVVLAAQLVPWKGHRLLLEAAPELLRQVPSAYLLLVGEDLFADHPGYRSELQSRAAELGLTERLFFLGYRQEMPAVLAAADVVVCASEGEPFGRTLIEAMSLAKPVVATDAGGPREIVVPGETGRLVPVGNAAALAAALIELARDPDRARAMGRQGRERVLKHFTLAAHIKRIEEVYIRMLERSPLPIPPP